MAYNSSTHVITAIVYDNLAGSTSVEPEINSANPGAVNGWTVHSINLSAKTWTKTYNTETLGAAGAITTGSPVSVTFDAIQVAVFVQNELEAQELSIAGENANAQTAAQIAAVQANIADLNNYTNLGVSAGTVWGAGTEGYPASGGSNPLTPGTDGN